MSETFRLGLRREFRAEHTLAGPGQTFRHGHDYVWEVRLEAPALDEHGYLVDLVALEALVDEVAARYRHTHLNDLPAFQGLNPSLECFVRQLGIEVAQGLGILPGQGFGVESVLWEHPGAWASWSHGGPARHGQGN